MPTFEWDAWFAYLWRYARTDYTLPPLLLTIGYVLRVPVLALSSWAWRKEREGKAAAGGGPHGKGPPAVPALCPAGFSQWWLLAAPGMLQLIFLRGILWKHQTALLPFTPVVAIAAALAIVAVSRHLAAVLATAVALVIVASLRFVIAALGNVAGTSLNLLTLAILVGGGAIAVSLARRAISTPRKIFARL